MRKARPNGRNAGWARLCIFMRPALPGADNSLETVGNFIGDNDALQEQVAADAHALPLFY